MIQLKLISAQIQLIIKFITLMEQIKYVQTRIQLIIIFLRTLPNTLQIFNIRRFPSSGSYGIWTAQGTMISYGNHERAEIEIFVHSGTEFGSWHRLKPSIYYDMTERSVNWKYDIFLTIV